MADDVVDLISDDDDDKVSQLSSARPKKNKSSSQTTTSTCSSSLHRVPQDLSSTLFPSSPKGSARRESASKRATSFHSSPAKQSSSSKPPSPGQAEPVSSSKKRKLVISSSSSSSNDEEEEDDDGDEGSKDVKQQQIKTPGTTSSDYDDDEDDHPSDEEEGMDPPRTDEDVSECSTLDDDDRGQQHRDNNYDDFDEILDDYEIPDAVLLPPSTTTTTMTRQQQEPIDTICDDEEEDADHQGIVSVRARLTAELKLLDVEEKNLGDELIRVQTMLANIRSTRESYKRELACLRMDCSKDKTWSSEQFPHSRTLRDQLFRIFGFSKFRELQLEVMNATLVGRDCFVVLPTGSGKSLLFQLPAVVQGGITIVISPLLSLSRDQLMNLRDKGINGVMISSEQGTEELKQSYSRLFNGDSSLRLVYVTPEMLVQSKKFVSALEALNRLHLLTRIVVDEAHCCSTMGHDFRPDYQKLFFLKRQFPSVPLLCVTATATVKVEEDVKRVLLKESGAVVEDCLVFRASFNRPNLAYEIIEKKAEGAAFNTQLCELVADRFPQMCGIVYCLSRKDTEHAADALRKAGVSAKAYHAKLPSRQKTDTHERWRTGKTRVVCATTAFGMGIDKPNVRFVIHSTLTTSIEGYAQESGRAGRDGLPSTCVLLYRRADVSRVSQLISDRQNGPDKLFEMIRYAENVHECRRVVMGRCFGEMFDPAKCLAGCDVCSRAAAAVVVSSKPATTTPVVLPVMVDHTLQAENLLRRYLKQRSIANSYLTMNQLVELWRGSDASLFKAPPKWSRADCERLILHMLLQNVFKIHWTYNAHRTMAYLDQGERAHLLLRQFEPDQVKVKYHVLPGDKTAKGKGTPSPPAKPLVLKPSASSALAGMFAKASSLSKEAEDQKEESEEKPQSAKSSAAGIAPKPKTSSKSSNVKGSASENPLAKMFEKSQKTNQARSETIHLMEDEDDIWETPTISAVKNKTQHQREDSLFAQLPPRQDILAALSSSSAAAAAAGTVIEAPHIQMLHAVAPLPMASTTNVSRTYQAAARHYDEQDEEFDPDAYYGC